MENEVDAGKENMAVISFYRAYFRTRWYSQIARLLARVYYFNFSSNFITSSCPLIIYAASVADKPTLTE